MVAPGEAFEVQPFWRAVSKSGSATPIGVVCRHCGQGGGREVQVLATGHADSTVCMGSAMPPTLLLLGRSLPQVLLELRGQSDADYDELDEGTQVARIQVTASR